MEPERGLFFPCSDVCGEDGGQAVFGRHPAILVAGNALSGKLRSSVGVESGVNRARIASQPSQRSQRRLDRNLGEYVELERVQ